MALLWITWNKSFLQEGGVVYHLMKLVCTFGMLPCKVGSSSNPSVTGMSTGLASQQMNISIIVPWSFYSPCHDLCIDNSPMNYVLRPKPANGCFNDLYTVFHVVGTHQPPCKRALASRHRAWHSRRSVKKQKRIYFHTTIAIRHHTLLTTY